MTYRKPTSIVEWKKDESDSEFYAVSIMDDNTVISACGRYAQGSGSATVSWTEFLHGEMNELVEETMGSHVLKEI